MQRHESGARDGAEVHLVCYVDSEESGGAESSLAILLGALDGHIRPTVVGHDREVVERVAAGRPGTATRLVPAVRSRRNATAIGAQIGAVRRLRPDILHVNLRQPWSGQYGLLAGVLTRTPMVAVVHSDVAAHRPTQQWLVRRLAQWVDIYATPSRALAGRTEELLGLRAGAVRVIPNAVQAPARLATDRLTTRPLIGVVGRLSREKGVDVAVAAMAELPDCGLVVVGEGPERPALEAVVRHLGMEGRVTFAGWSPPPWSERWTFDVLVVPSRSESFGMVIAEAMNAGIPVVASRVGGTPEVLVEGETGLLVPPDDAGALAEAVRHLVADDERRRTMGRRGQTLAAERFSPPAMARRYQGLYRAVMR